MTSGYLPEIENFTKQQFLNRDALVALIDQIGPAILMVHSQAGAFGWPVADARPDQVKAILAVEPNGPPFYQGRFHRCARLYSSRDRWHFPMVSARCRSPILPPWPTRKSSPSFSRDRLTGPIW